MALPSQLVAAAEGHSEHTAGPNKREASSTETDTSAESSMCAVEARMR